MEPTPEPRLRQADRTVLLPPASLEDTLPPEHPVRIVWEYVAALDLSDFLATIKAVDGHPGRNATDPRILLALWMYATLDGVGSARQLERLCQVHLAYRWLCGGVTVNYGLLSAFRSDHEAELNTLFINHVAALLHEGLVSMQRVAQDGVRVRANAGSSSFRRVETLQEHQQAVAEQLAALREQPDEAPGSAARRSQQAKLRHLQERQERLAQAHKVAAAADAQRAERARLHPAEAQQRYGGDEHKSAGRASMTDPEARRMKMADGGYRPAYNVQAATATAAGLIVGVAVSSQGSDGGLMGEMTEQLQASYGHKPKEMLVDGGFGSVADVEAAAAAKIAVYAPLKNAAADLRAGKDPYTPKPTDRVGMAQLRQRMGTAEAKAIYKERAATAEWVNAGFRNRGMYQFRVRGVRKVRAVVLLQAMVHNLFQTIRLCAAQRPDQRWSEVLGSGLSQQKKG